MSEELLVKNKLVDIYYALVQNKYIAGLTKIKDSEEFRVKLYNYPETGDKSGAFITIRPVQPQSTAYMGSDKELSVNFFYQIDVEAGYSSTCKQIQREIKKVLAEMQFYQTDGGLDEYFPETRRFVDARRYSGNSRMYDTNY